jgi:hypothetical protein
LAKLLSAVSAVRGGAILPPFRNGPATGWPILERLAEALEAQIVGFFVVPAPGDLFTEATAR